MYIVLHCGGLPFNGQTIRHKSLGGSETAAYYMAKELAALGHDVTLFTNVEPQGEGTWDGVKYRSVGPVNQQYPLGAVFDYYATHTPTDVLIMQRNPGAFNKRYASKINLWWLHDLALMNIKELVTNHLWNIDGILTVSEFHRQQVIDTWGLDPDIVFAIQNGVDISLFEKSINYLMNAEGGLTNLTMETQTSSGDGSQIKLLYTSRPERGLEWLVKPDGIMHRLSKLDNRFHLYVCGYDNTTPQMAQYYDQLWKACEVLPNVTNLGALTKQELADVMRQCDALVYPTPSSLQPKFEEVSCITAMECMAAGLPFISTKAGALPETCEGSGSILLPLKDGLPDVDLFVGRLEAWFAPEHEGDEQHKGDKAFMKNQQLKAAKRFTLDIPAKTTMDIVEGIFEKLRSNPGSVLRHLVDMSDIYAARYYVDELKPDDPDGILHETMNEMAECYAFMEQPSLRQHYEEYYQYEKDRGVEYGPEDVTNTPRFRFVASLIRGLPVGSTVMDYGCAHGHFTVNLARIFPDVNFVGIDIAQSNINTARGWAAAEELTNVRFVQGELDPLNAEFSDAEGQPVLMNPVDFIIAAEVIEHLEDYRAVVDGLCTYLSEQGTFCATTPYGPWEAQGYLEHWPWRAHVHHFERQDLDEAFGHHPLYSCTCIPHNPRVGSYAWVFQRPVAASRAVDYDRKLRQVAPRQTTTACLIAGQAAPTVMKALESLIPMVDEIIVAVDKKSEDNTMEVIDSYLTRYFQHRPWKTFYIESPRDIGFDAARNQSLEGASGDWILWIDADEQIYYTELMLNMLRNSMFKGFGLPQHHFALQPLGVMKTDYPCRLFRNHRNVRFYGKVHEHPEIVMNEGLGHVYIVQEAQIVHPAYLHEPIRQGRFDRNIPLLVQDREANPERKLGKFLWLRDLAQMCEQSIRRNGMVTAESKERAREGVRIWEELLGEGNPRLVIDSLPFYSTCVKILGEGFHADLGVNIAKHKEQMNGGGMRLEADFLNKEHYMSVLDLVAEERIKPYGSKYYV